MSTINVLGVAPFENLRHLMGTIAETKAVQFTGILGDLEAGVAIAKQKAADFDVIISRGGTAEALKRLVDIPVIEVDISAYDLLRVFKLAQAYSGVIAMIGFANITRQAKTVADLLDLNMMIITINHSDELPEIIANLRGKVNLIIGDYITAKMATKNEINAMLITSGQESVTAAFDKALSIGKTMQQLRQNSLFQQDCYAALQTAFLVVDQQHHICFRSTKQLPEYLYQKMTQLIPLFQTDHWTTYRQFYGKHYEINCQTMDQHYYLQIRPNRWQKKEAFHLLSAKDLTQHIGTFIPTFIKQFDFEQQLKPLTLLLGETGTGKTNLAYLIARKRPTDTIWKIALAHLKSDAFAQLLHSEDSPFLDQHCLFILTGCETLTAENLQQLITFIQDSQLKNHYLLLYTLQTDHENLPDTIQALAPTNRIKLTPLREQKENIHQISILAINQLNEKYHQQILGIEPAGVEALTAFPWPHNFDQLYSVLDRLVQQSKSDYLNTQLVQSVLTETQTAATPPVTPEPLLDLIAETDLATLNTRIAQEVLQNSNGNQSLTARKLGISRTTLWRMLKRQ